MKPKNGVLTGNQLKLFALVAMTCDHVGKAFFPDLMILQIFGRLAYPIFAYMIAEGCRYTKNRRRYLAVMVAIAVLCQIFYGLAEKSLYQCILVTFSLSVILIYVIDCSIENDTPKNRFYVLVTLLAIVFLTEGLPLILNDTDFAIDYGLFGIILPVAVYYSEGKWAKLLAESIFLLILSVYIGGMQWFSLLALIPLALYGGKRGKINMKHLFYIYYPAHLVVIYFIAKILHFGM